MVMQHFTTFFKRYLDSGVSTSETMLLLTPHIYKQNKSSERTGVFCVHAYTKLVQ